MVKGKPKLPLISRAILKGARYASSAVASLTDFFFNSYPSLDYTRKEIFNDFRPRYGSSNQVLGASLTTLSTQCRHLERFTPLGRSIVEGLVSDIIGSGIDVLPNSGSESLDADLIEAWHDWAEDCINDGSSLWEWQGVVVRELATSGAALARLVIDPGRAAAGKVPLMIVPLEIEWLCEYPLRSVPKGRRYVRGIEVDSLGRPVAYHLRNPELPWGAPGEIVKPAEILHIFERRRAQQVHGEPILAPVVERCLQDARLIETELKAAVSTAAPAVAIESEAGGFVDGNESDTDSEPVTDIPAGAVARLMPGEKVSTIENKRPSQQIAPFRGTIRGDLAGACRVSQYWLDRDASRANYSSMRMDQLLTKRVLTGLKKAVGRGAAGDVYRQAYPWLMLKMGRAMPLGLEKIEQRKRYYLRPDQPEYVDPEKDGKASAQAIGDNLSTYDLELSARGKDWRQVFHQRQVENAELEKLGLAVAAADQATEPVAESATDQNPQPVEEQEEEKELKTEIIWDRNGKLAAAKVEGRGTFLYTEEG